MHMQLQAHQAAIPCPLTKLTDCSRVVIILFLKTSLSNTCELINRSGTKPPLYTTDTAFKASEQSLYIPGEYFRGAFLSFQEDTEFEHKLENKSFLLYFFLINSFSYLILKFLHNYVRFHSYLAENRAILH